MSTIAALNVAITASTANFRKGLAFASQSAAEFEKRQFKLKEVAGLTQRALGEQTGSIGYLASAMHGLGPIFGSAAAAIYIFNKRSEDAAALQDEAAAAAERLKKARAGINDEALGAFSGQSVKKVQELDEQIAKMKGESETLKKSWSGSDFSKSLRVDSEVKELEKLRAEAMKLNGVLGPLDQLLNEIDEIGFADAMTFESGSTKALEHALDLEKARRDALDESLSQLNNKTVAYAQVLERWQSTMQNILRMQDELAAKQEQMRKEEAAGKAKRLADALDESAEVSDVRDQIAQLQQKRADILAKQESRRNPFGTFQQIDTSLINVEGLARQKREVQEVTSPQLESIDEQIKRLNAKISPGFGGLG